MTAIVKPLGAVGVMTGASATEVTSLQLTAGMWPMAPTGAFAAPTTSKMENEIPAPPELWTLNTRSLPVTAWAAMKNCGSLLSGWILTYEFPLLSVTEVMFVRFPELAVENTIRLPLLGACAVRVPGGTSFV
jgi:hypothetical protein